MATEETRRAAACRSFWSDDPLNVRFRSAVGGRPFSLKEFISFVLAMPAAEFARVVGRSEVA
ncbi:hypothetical protein [Bradyrhizobium prioriisuperbiae]|uniref:hypothetical protein n=1 Tax=Bradyrhizobium prioriisuperbiae TaxID=2854389 RepID=UPI0028E68DE5|nr:hypothetical protein [Bradyrhizobium prioritasuperba]